MTVTESSVPIRKNAFGGGNAGAGAAPPAIAFGIVET
jgi:hypothetical protein